MITVPYLIGAEKPKLNRYVVNVEASPSPGVLRFLRSTTLQAPAPVRSADDALSSFIRAGRRRVTWPRMAAKFTEIGRIMNHPVQEQTLQHLDFVGALPCEGVHHTRGLSGHDPIESGGFMVISPCCGPKVVQCSSRVDAMRESGVLYCGECQHEHSTNEYTFLPL